MPSKDCDPKCTLILIADGFKDTETITLISTLRQAGLCVKSVALTNSLVSSMHGICLMPDLTLTDLDRWLDTMAIALIILPEGEWSLTRLASDPRVHKLLRQVVARDGQIATSPKGLGVIRAATVWAEASNTTIDEPEKSILLRGPRQSAHAFGQGLIRRLKQRQRNWS